MKILDAKYLLICDEEFSILEDKAICFDEKIIDIDSEKNLIKKYPNAQILRRTSVVLPAFINLHTHLEFSANKSILTYGDFIKWLNSVIKNRDEIMELSNEVSMQNALDEMIKSGVGTIGAISSAGFDLEVCAKSKARVVYFNEILGSNPSSVDILYADFKNRLQVSLKEKNERFIPAISVHSAYSTHPILAKKALKIAQDNDLLVSTHFMESIAERHWLDNGSGDFNDFFKPFNPYAKPFLNPTEYIELFKENKTLFTHCCYANDNELNAIKNQNATITHCPRSNRLLGSNSLNIKPIFEKNINFTLGTDGLSSNNTLNIWDELRAGLFLHGAENLQLLAQNLLKSVTLNPAKALGLNIGSLKVGQKADLISIDLAQAPKDLEQLAVQVILHTKEAENVFIGGEKIL